MMRWKKWDGVGNSPSYAIKRDFGYMVLQQEVEKQEDEWRENCQFPKKVTVKVWEDVPVVFEKAKGARA